MKRFSIFVLLGILAFAVCGCFEEESPFIVEETIDLQSPNGIYETILLNGAKEAFEKIDWEKYKSKDIYFEVQEINDGYLDNVVSALIEHKFLEINGNILAETKEGEEKADHDYDVYITIPVSGVYYYEGFFKRHYVSYVMLNLFETQKDGSEQKTSSGLIETEFDKFIPSRILVISLWVIIAAIIIMLVFKILFSRYLGLKR